MSFIEYPGFTLKLEQDIINLFEQRIYNYAANLYANRYNENEIGAHEIEHCPRSSFVYRKYDLGPDDLTTAYHFTIGNLYETMMADVLKWGKWSRRKIEAEERVESKKTYRDKYRVVGHIDFGTMVGNLGIIETKTKFMWYTLQEWLGSPITAKMYRGKKVYEKPVGPDWEHIDRILTYLWLSLRKVGNILYISKYWLEGILPFKVEINQDTINYIDNILNLFVNIYTEFLDLYENDADFSDNYSDLLEKHPTIKSGRKYVENIESSDIERNKINQIPAIPYRWCKSCIWGGYTKKDGKKYKKPNGIRYPNLCDVSLDERGYPRSIFGKKPETEFIKGKKRVVPPEYYPDIPGFQITENKVARERIVDNVIEYIADNIQWKYNINNLFGCPRKANYYNNYNIREIFSGSNRGKKLAVWIWKMSTLGKYLLWVYDSDFTQLDIKFPFTPVSIDDKDISYTGEAFRLDGNITHIVPTAKIYIYKTKETPFPRFSDLIKCLLLQNILNEDSIKLLYHGIRSTNMLIFDVKPERSAAMSKLSIDLERKVTDIENDIPVPDKYCIWCPLLDLKRSAFGESSEEYICPEGRRYYSEELYKDLSQLIQKIPKTTVKINNKQCNIPSYEPGPLESIELDDLLDITK